MKATTSGRRTLGRTGLHVSPITLGATPVAGPSPENAC